MKCMICGSNNTSTVLHGSVTVSFKCYSCKAEFDLYKRIEELETEILDLATIAEAKVKSLEAQVASLTPGPYDVVVTVPELRSQHVFPLDQPARTEYFCDPDCLLHYKCRLKTKGEHKPDRNCPRHPDAPIMERGRTVEPGPYDIMVGGIKVGEIPTPAPSGKCSVTCRLWSCYGDVMGRCPLMDDDLKPSRNCPRHPDHGKDAEQGGEG